MKSVLLPLTAVALATLAGCAVVPYEPGVVYAAPVPPPVVVVRPSYGYYGHSHGQRHYRRPWRGHWR